MALSCFGKLCATEASKQPKKRYNDYVPAVFPTEAQDWRSPISAGTARNISTVQDYVGENIQRAPKVSRRLWRRIGADHANDAALGQVKVAVHCYIGLLSSMSEGDTSLLSEEIIRKDDSVVPLILSAQGDSAENKGRRILGLELLGHFIRAQSSSDVARMLAKHTQEACKMLQQGGCAELDSAALRVLHEYVSYTRRLNIPCEHLRRIQSTAQDWLLRDSKETGVTAMDPGFLKSQQVDDLYTTAKTSRVAQALLLELSLLCQDATVGAQVVADGLDSISSDNAWDGGSRQEATLQALRAGQQSSGAQLLLLSGLLDELHSPSLQDSAAPAVLSAAAHEASLLPSSLAPSAMAKLLTATAPLLAVQDSTACGEKSPATIMVGECLRGLVSGCKEPELLLESIATTLTNANPRDAKAAIPKVKAANIAIGCLPTGVQVPTVLYTELCRLATMPEQDAGDSMLELQTCATRATTDTLRVCGGVPRPVAVQALLQNVDHQLAPTPEHTPAQLAAAAELHNEVVARVPVDCVVQSANATVPRIRGAATAPRGAANAVEVIYVNQQCLNAAFQRLQPPQSVPALLPQGCTSLQQDTSSERVVATGAKQDEASAQATLQALNQTGQAEKVCAAADKVLARHQQPTVATGSTGSTMGAAWAPNAAALADAAAVEHGDGYVLDSADPLTGSEMEGQRRREDTHGADSAGQSTWAGQVLPTGAALSHPTAPSTTSPTPIWGQAANGQAAPTSAATPAAPPPPSEPVATPHPTPAIHTPQPSQPETVHQCAPIPLEPNTNSAQAAPPAAGASAVSSTAGDPSISLNGMLPAPPAAAPALDEAATRARGPDELDSASENSSAAPSISAGKLANRRVYNPAVGTCAVSDDAATAPQLSDMPSGIPQTPVPEVYNGSVQVSAVSADTLAAVNGADNEMHDESLSLPLGPPRANKPLHVLPLASPPSKPPKGVPALTDGQRDSAWSPPPVNTTRSLHALPGGSESHRGVTPTSSIGDMSSWSRFGIGRSVHAVSKDGNERSKTELLVPGRAGASPGSPSGMSMGSCASGARRRGRPSLHVMPGRDTGPLPDASTAPV